MKTPDEIAKELVDLSISSIGIRDLDWLKDHIAEAIQAERERARVLVEALNDIANSIEFSRDTAIKRQVAWLQNTARQALLAYREET